MEGGLGIQILTIEPYWLKIVDLTNLDHKLSGKHHIESKTLGFGMDLLRLEVLLMRILVGSLGWPKNSTLSPISNPRIVDKHLLNSNRVGCPKVKMYIQ